MKHSIPIFVIIFSILIIGCDKQEVPRNDGAPVSKEQIIGSWTVTSSEAYLKLDNLYQSQSDFFEDLLRIKLTEESTGSTLCFTSNDKVYCFQNQIMSDSSNYSISRDTMYLSNPNLIGFYAPHFYLKKDTVDIEMLTAYLGKEESMLLMENDGSIPASSLTLMRERIKEAQCEIRFTRDTSAVYQYLFQ